MVQKDTSINTQKLHLRLIHTQKPTIRLIKVAKQVKHTQLPLLKQLPAANKPSNKRSNNNAKQRSSLQLFYLIIKGILQTNPPFRSGQ